MKLIVLSQNCNSDSSQMRRGPMLPKKDTLPGSKVELSIRDRNIERSRCQDRANVRRHVVHSLGRMLELRVAVGNQPREEAFQIAPDTGVGIFTHDQRSTCVMNKDRAEAGLRVRFAHDFLDLVGDLGRASASGTKGEG